MAAEKLRKEYSKLILIDTERKKMHQATIRRLLLEIARKIEGEKILFTLDNDELLSGDFVHTIDWKKKMEFKPTPSFEVG